MKQEFNVKGKSVDEAYKKALELYSSLGDISLEEVVNPGKKGFLGLFGAVDAEIRISVDDGTFERKPKPKKPQQNNQPKQNNEVKAENKQPQEKKVEKKPEQKVENKTENKAENKPEKKQPENCTFWG